MEQNNKTPIQPPLQGSEAEQKAATSKHSNFLKITVPVFCFFVGIPLLVFPLIIMFLILPRLNTLYSSLDIEAPNFLLIYAGMALVALLGLVNIFFGVKLLKTPTFLKRAFFVSISSFILLGVFVGFTILSSINPIYNIVNHIGQTACTQEVKICPDGTSVGRTGPKCEFSPCSTSSKTDETTGWKKITDPQYKYSLSYPSSLQGLNSHTNDYSFEEWVFYESEPGIVVNNISLDVYSKSIKVDSVRATVPQERLDYLKLLSLKEGQNISDVTEIGFNCTNYIRDSEITINGNDWITYKTFKSSKPCIVGTWYNFLKLAILQKDEVIYVLEVKPYTDKADDKLLLQFNQILSTFKFTK